MLLKKVGLLFINFNEKNQNDSADFWKANSPLNSADCRKISLVTLILVFCDNEIVFHNDLVKKENLVSSLFIN